MLEGHAGALDQGADVGIMRPNSSVSMPIFTATFWKTC